MKLCIYLLIVGITCCVHGSAIDNVRQQWEPKHDENMEAMASTLIERVGVVPPYRGTVYYVHSPIAEGGSYAGMCRPYGWEFLGKTVHPFKVIQLDDRLKYGSGIYKSTLLHEIGHCLYGLDHNDAIPLMREYINGWTSFGSRKQFYDWMSSRYNIWTYIKKADGLRATTYGWGEGNCCDVGKACKCEKGAVTASGQPFDPDLPTCAVPAPTKLRMVPIKIYARVDKGPCVMLVCNDKSSPKWIGQRGLDLTPGALRKLGVNPHKHWSGTVHICKETT